VTLRARWVTLTARWVTLTARWVTLRARWVTPTARWGDVKEIAGVCTQGRWLRRCPPPPSEDACSITTSLQAAEEAVEEEEVRKPHVNFVERRTAGRIGSAWLLTGLAPTPPHACCVHPPLFGVSLHASSPLVPNPRSTQPAVRTRAVGPYEKVNSAHRRRRGRAWIGGGGDGGGRRREQPHVHGLRFPQVRAAHSSCPCH
jgi:hypothetical protein